ncbi:hypothetical protein VIGAN_11124000 [Vigna angularis var. angularis]|uniref:Uncharacterized protein n=1 Tax=Vigna angularis var. angularis TaxID=157739 RepID=A0A0S3TA63_PHAAN|nr:hypothetical protein VIGAN_11124000 [Vigna angularis var. angularis]
MALHFSFRSCWNKVKKRCWTVKLLNACWPRHPILLYSNVSFFISINHRELFLCCSCRNLRCVGCVKVCCWNLLFYKHLFLKQHILFSKEM